MLNTQSLKTVIAIILTLLLLIVVILVDFVFVSTSQKDYIAQKTKEGRVLALSVQNALSIADKRNQPSSLPAKTKTYFKKIAGINDITSMVIVGPDRSLLYTYPNDSNDNLQKIITNQAIGAILSGKFRTSLYGKIWGVFFIRNHYLIISSPIQINDTGMQTAVSTAVDLAPFYELQRENQLIIFYYTIINVLILMILGTYAISKSTIRPINSLVKRAEERQEDDNLGFFYSPGKNEFRRLSNSLNRMLDRIEGDKRQLEGSLLSLEEANKEIKEHQNELIRAEKLASVGRLSAGIAHEIGNPIGIVLGYLDMLHHHKDLTETDRIDYITRCQNEIQKINTIIRELLDFSRPASKGATETVSVHALIKETMDLLSVQPVMRDIICRYEFNADRDIISTIPDKLRQVFVNLILNAADAISTNLPGKGEIIIRTSATTGTADSGDMICIEFGDNGAGIDEADLETIFDPFYTTKEPGQGTGLGLYVCYMIIDNMDGVIKVFSKLGEGTIFTVHIPRLSTDI